MSSTALLALDKAFLLMIREVERGYQLLSKQQRLRIEKWVEKLVTSSVDNHVWRRDRNEYAKLLLHMVISKKLNDPFHVCPPDGPLAQFPKHLRQYQLLYKASDSHEISFWREIYQRLGDRQSRIDLSSTSKFDESLESHPITSTNSLSSDRELKYLKICDGEHKLRIELLEQQLKDEKMHYGFQIRRLESAHRMEVSAYAETIAATSMYSNNVFNRSMTSPSIKEPEKDRDRYESVSRRSFPGSFPEIHTEKNSLTPADRGNGQFSEFQRHYDSHQETSLDVSTSNNIRSSSGNEGNDFFSSESSQNSTYSRPPISNAENYQESHKENPTVDSGAFENGIRFQGSESPNFISESYCRVQKIPMSASNIFDDEINSRTSHSTSMEPNRDVSKRYQKDEMGGSSLFTEKKTGVPKSNLFFSSKGIGNDNTSISAIEPAMKDISSVVNFSIADVRQIEPLQIRQYDDNFLAYIDEFQTEIHKLQSSSPFRKSRIMS